MMKKVLSLHIVFQVFLMSDLIKNDWILIFAIALNMLHYTVLFKVYIKHSLSHR